MAYSPLHSPQKPVSFERMQEILAKHVGHPVEIKPVEAKPSKPSSSDVLRWKRIGPDSIQCTRGPVILRTLDSSSRDIYIVFSGSSSGGQTAPPLAKFHSSQDAKDFVRLLPVKP